MNPSIFKKSILIEFRLENPIIWCPDYVTIPPFRYFKPWVNDKSQFSLIKLFLKKGKKSEGS